MGLTPRSRLGVYEIAALLGAGGMGEVYRARDTKLGRDVALKVLPDTFARDADRLARFQREAQVLASLNHPHIGSIYGFEDSGARPALVLELVEGPTLADRIAQGPLPLDEALPIARQIAEALEAAHDGGIVHRDLKPANVKLAADGRVKVLDFGLAKLTDPGVPGGRESQSMSPTMLSPAMMTGAGAILGTAAYMAPEQAKGHAVDQRADVWAFGCVLYEMLTGRAPFTGESVSEVVSEVLKTDLDWRRLPPDTPAAVRRLLARTLQKDPARRLHHMADARLEIEEALGGPSDVPPVAAPRTIAAPVVRALPWAVAALALGAAGWMQIGRPDGSRAAPVARLEVHVPPGVELFTATTLSLAIAPDGSRLAFVAVRGGARVVYVRALDQFEAVPVRGSDGATTCFFSPDGRAIGIIDAGGVLKTIDLSSGTVTTVTGDASFVAGAAWGAGGRIVFGRDRALWHVVLPGGSPTPLTRLDGPPRDIEHAQPSFLPGGETLLFSARSGETDRRMEALVVATGERHVLVEDASLARYVGSGHLAFYRSGGVFVAPLDARTLRVTGPMVKMVDLQQPTAVPDLDVSVSGTLVYAPLAAQSSLVWVSRDGAEQPLNDQRRPYVSPRLSPDATSLAVQADDVWVQDIRRSVFTRLAPTDSVAFPIWTPDSRRVIFKTSTDLRQRRVDGSGSSEAIPGTGPSDYPGAVTPDGGTLVFLRSSQQTSFDIYTVPFPGGGEATALLASSAYEGGARLSPDGRWLVYVSNDSGRYEIYVRPFPGPDRRIPVSTDGGTQPMWDARGGAIYYRSGDRLMTVDLSNAAGDLVLSPPRLLFERQYAFGAGITIANYDATPDGQRFLMVKDQSLAGRVNVVVNWASELARVVPAGAAP